MKKLMIAALVAGAVGATFADCEIQNACAYAYRVKLAGKTVKGKEKAAASSCETGVCWAKKASLRIAGYIYNPGTENADGSVCDCECDGHWDLSDNASVFWNEKKYQVLADVTAAEIDVYDILRNSGAQNIAQLGIKLGDLYLAGFGKFNPVSHRLKRASGFFAGTLPTPKCETYNQETCELEGTDAEAFNPCTLENAPIEKAIAYGRWNMAWKHEKVALLEAGKEPLSAGVLIPAAFVAAE